MNRDEARVWMAQNPGREVVIVPGGVRFRMNKLGFCELFDAEFKKWERLSVGLSECYDYTIVEPEKPKEDELLESMKCWDKAWMAAAIRAEIARIADERIAKAKVESKVPGDQWQINAYTRLIPGDA